MTDQQYKLIKILILRFGLTYDQWRDLYLTLKLKPNGKSKGLIINTSA